MLLSFHGDQRSHLFFFFFRCWDAPVSLAQGRQAVNRGSLLAVTNWSSSPYSLAFTADGGDVCRHPGPCLAKIKTPCLLGLKYGLPPKRETCFNLQFVLFFFFFLINDALAGPYGGATMDAFLGMCRPRIKNGVWSLFLLLLFFFFFPPLIMTAMKRWSFG